MNGQPSERRSLKRPALVWLLSSFYISAGLWSLLVYFQMLSGASPLPPSVLAHFENYSRSDYWLLMSVAALNVIAGALFLLLRREAVYVFGFKFLVAVPLSVWDALTRDAMDRSEPGNIVVALLLWSASAAVFFYAWKLRKKGVLR